MAPSVVLLFLWMIVPLVMTIWFSFRCYNLHQRHAGHGFAGLDNYRYMLTDPSLLTAMLNTLYLVVSVLVITVGLGTLLAVLFDREFLGRNIARLLVIAPFFVMPTVSALIWKNMLMHPVNGLFAFFTRSLGFSRSTGSATMPLTSVIMIVAWQWLPFALLILLTAMQSLDHEQKEAARMDGAKPLSHVLLHHPAAPQPRDHRRHHDRDDLPALGLRRDPGDDDRRPGHRDHQPGLPDLSSRRSLNYDVGLASAGGMIAVVLANIVAVFLVRAIAKNVDD